MSSWFDNEMYISFICDVRYIYIYIYIYIYGVEYPHVGIKRFEFQVKKILLV